MGFSVCKNNEKSEVEVRIWKKFLAGLPSRPFEAPVVPEPVQSRWLEDPLFWYIALPNFQLVASIGRELSKFLPNRAWIV